MTTKPFFLTPLGNRCIVKPDEFEHKGRIIIPDKAKHKTTTGRILAMGEPHEKLQVGLRVLFDMFSGGEMGFQGDETNPDIHLRHISYDEIIGIINDEGVKTK